MKKKKKKKSPTEEVNQGLRSGEKNEKTFK